MPTTLPTPVRLRTLFDPAPFARAERHQAEGRVTEWQVEHLDGAPVVTGRVEGVGGPAHEVYIRIEGDEVDGDCDCADGRNCEHVAAVLLTAVAGADRPTPPVAPLPLPLPTPAPAVAPQPERLLYLLTPCADPPRVEVRVLVGGADGTLHDFPPRRAWDPYLPACLRPEDVQWLRALAPATFARAAERVALPLGGGFLLRALLESGRCHWPDPTAPALRLGGRRRGELYWELLDDGRQRLVARTDADEDLLPLPLNPPWYLDPELATCGPLESGLPEQVDLYLVTHPLLTLQQAVLLRRQVEAGALDPALPLPQAVQARTVAGVRPTPRLYFHRLPLAADQPPAPAVRLAFDYDGTSVAAESEESLSVMRHGEQVVFVERDRACEREVQSGLRALGLVPATRFAPTGEGGGSWVAAEPARRAPLLLELQQRARANGWPMEWQPGFAPRLVEAESWQLALSDGAGGNWLDLELGILVEGERVSLLPLLMQWLREAPDPGAPLRDLPPDAPLLLPIDAERSLHLPAERLRRILATLIDLQDPHTTLRDGRLPLSAARVGELAELDRAGWRLSGTLHWRERAERLRDFTAVAPVAPPAGLRASLRPYQRAGLDWLQFLRAYDLGGLLADDMGLGKTLQVLAHLLVEKEAGRLDRPALVVAPTSLLFNWRDEAARFAPELRVLALHGPDRHTRFPAIAGHDLLLTTYPLLARDQEVLAAHAYHLLVLDEAQAVKNPRTRAREALLCLDARHRLCLTGTPLENHLGELWSLYDLLLPGLLGEEAQFRRLFRLPIERQHDAERGLALAGRIRPFLLRRTKAEVATDLPPKTEIRRSIALEGSQRDLYETIRLSVHERVREAISEQGLARSRIVILDALLKLRQVCCDPRLLKGSDSHGVRSAKLELLMELLPPLLEEGRRVLLFSQFTGMLALIERELAAAGLPWLTLTGRTRDRAEPVRRFQAGEVPLFLISLKAGGTGLNLTAADTVIHYDPWWNPAVEEQASDRAHRIGQRNPVFVYRLVTEGTVEQKVLELQERKRHLANALFGQGGGGGGLQAGDLAGLFEPLE